MIYLGLIELGGTLDLFVQNKYAPVVLFVYKRFDLTKRTIEALANNELANETEVFVFSDGAKNDNDRIEVDKVRSLIEEYSNCFKRLSIIKRLSNYGLARNIIEGVTDVIDQYGRVIVLEDDILTSKFFLQYMNDALQTYDKEENVMEISAYSYPIKEKVSQTAFLKWESCWGWATWKRAWDKYEKDATKLVKTFSFRDIYHFDLEGSCGFWWQVRYNYYNRINTWAVFWAATIYLNGGLMLYPGESMAVNIGFDGSGENSQKGSSFLVEEKRLCDHPVDVFPDMIREDKRLRKSLNRYLRSTWKSTLFAKIRYYTIELVEDIKVYIDAYRNEHRG